MNLKKLSVVLPVFNEEAIIGKLASEIEAHVEQPLELVFVNDGSTDRTLEVLKEYRTKKGSNSKKIVDLSRNFGHQQALMAGLDSVSEDADLVLVMDADFQDNPEDIPQLLKKLGEGYDCVYAIRKANTGNFLINVLSRSFYKMQKAILSFSIPRNAGTFSVFNRAFLDVLLNFREVDVYFPGLRAYVGMNQTGFPVKREKRMHGKSRVGIVGLFNLALAGLIGFSSLPMRAIFFLGVLMTIFFFLLTIIVFLMKIFGITKIPGVTTVMILMLGISGLQITFLGIIGEYVGRLFTESKKRPRAVIREIID